MIYTGITGTNYTLIEPALGKGKEGIVYKIVGMTGYVVKIMTDEFKTETKHRKILTMINSKLSPSAMSQVTWPVDVVYERGKFVGYVMPAIHNSEHLNVIYSNKYKSTLVERIVIARNLCAAINAVHNANQVCGDLNPGNIQVNPQSARVTLIDTDSFHIKDHMNSREYRCEVGLPEYLPSEVQLKMKNGFRLDTAPLPTFTKHSDNFALAVHIFALLMNGCHPFACSVNNTDNIQNLHVYKQSVYAPQPIENITDGTFTFHTNKKNIKIPVYAPELNVLPKEVKDLFIQAFVNGHADPSKRPDSVQWYNALEKMQKNLSTCKVNNYHMFSSHLNQCPWCEVEKKMKNLTTSHQKQINNNQGTTNTFNQIITNTPIKATSTVATKTTPQINRDTSLTAHPGIFWIVTLFITVAVQGIFYITYSQEIISQIFGSKYGSGIESWGSNLAIWIGPWGFVICGLIGWYVFNMHFCEKGRIYGYKPEHYIQSILASSVFSVGWILVVFILSLAIAVIAVILVIAILCGLVSGS